MGHANKEPQLEVLAGNVAKLYHLALLEGALDRAGITSVRLKGSAYLGTLYPDLSRWMVDVDLLVREADLDAAACVTQELGYRLYPPEPGRTLSWERHYNRIFFGVPPHPTVELHTGICSRGMFDVDYGALFERRVRLTASGAGFWALSPEDALLHLAVHVVKDGYMHDERLGEDARRMIETWPPRWAVLCERAERWGVTSGLHYVLRLAQRRGGVVPATTMHALEPMWPASLSRTLFDRAAPLHTRFPRLTKLAALGLEPDGGTRVAKFAGNYAVRRALEAVLARL